MNHQLVRLLTSSNKYKLGGVWVAGGADVTAHIC